MERLSHWIGGKIVPGSGYGLPNSCVQSDRVSQRSWPPTRLSNAACARSIARPGSSGTVTSSTADAPQHPTRFTSDSMRETIRYAHRDSHEVVDMDAASAIEPASSQRARRLTGASMPRAAVAPRRRARG